MKAVHKCYTEAEAWKWVGSSKIGEECIIRLEWGYWVVYHLS